MQLYIEHTRETHEMYLQRHTIDLTDSFCAGKLERVIIKAGCVNTTRFGP